MSTVLHLFLPKQLTIRAYGVAGQGLWKVSLPTPSLVHVHRNRPYLIEVLVEVYPRYIHGFGHAHIIVTASRQVDPYSPYRARKPPAQGPPLYCFRRPRRAS